MLRKALLVASSGGHLTELALLRQRLGVEPTLWVSYDSVHARSVLKGQPFVCAYHPTTKSAVNALRNYSLARTVLAEHQADLLVSTGAGIAVPFFRRAQELGIPCHYIESAARTTGPSLTGRILRVMRDVHLYRQMGTWGGQRWTQGPSVFDGFGAEQSERSEVRRMVVSLGTHRYAFRSLIDRLAMIVQKQAPPDVEVIWQLGATRPSHSLPGEVVDQLPPDRLTALLASADLVVGHAGVGFALASLGAGAIPVLVPRRRSRREHTDDHQVQIASELERRGLAVTAEVPALSWAHLQTASSLASMHEEPPKFDLA